MDSIRKKMDSIQVAIKVRPLIEREIVNGHQAQWEVKGNSIFSIDPELRKRADYRYSFDHIFDPRTTNEEVFQVIVKPIIDAAINGFNGTVFAYGQTSSGKTYTMTGSEADPGIIQLAVHRMFDAINESKDREFLLRVSYLEIYNEKVKDLLTRDSAEVKIQESQGGIVNVPCKEDIINCREKVFNVMNRGEKNRKIGETNMNERSSRGHTIFRINIESRAVGADSDGAVQVSQINLVDLAGSERQGQAGTTGERFKEGTHINLSLTTLGKVIKQLSEGKDHVSFRDSKLTRLLQNPLSGNALVAFICAVTPTSLDETSCSLSFASRVKHVTTKPQINEVVSDATLLKRYAKLIEKLNRELEEMKKSNQLADVQEMESKLQEKVARNELLEERIALYKQQLLTGYSTQKEGSSKMSCRRRTWCGSGTLKQHSIKFPNDSPLETIAEMSPDKPSRKSIIQKLDLLDKTFEGFADFEVDLIKSERDRLAAQCTSDEVEDRVSVRKRVGFSDSVHTFETSNRTRETTPEVEKVRNKSVTECTLGCDSLEVTPEKKNTVCQPIRNILSPGTPRHVLRDTVTKLTGELDELREFTTLEKQTLCESSCVHRQETENLQKYILTLTVEKDNFERMSIDLRNELQKVKEESREVQRNIARDNEDLLQRLKTLSDTKMSLGETNAKLVQEVNEKTRELAEMQKQTQNLSLELSRKVEELQETKASMEKMNSKMTLQLIEKTRESEELLKTTLQENNELLQQVKELTDAKQTLELSNAKLVADIQKNGPVLVSTQEEFVQNDIDYLKKIKKQTTEKISLEKVNAQLMTSLQENDLLNEMQKLKDVKVKSEELNAKLMADLHVEKQKLESLESKIIQYADLSKENQSVIIAKASLEESNSRLKAELQEEKERVKEYQSKELQQDEFVKRVQQLTIAKESLEEANAKLALDLQEEKRRTHEMQLKITESENLAKTVEELVNADTSLEELNSILMADFEVERPKFEDFQKNAKQSGNLTQKVKELVSAKVSLEELNSKLVSELENARRTSEEIEGKAAKSDELARKIEELMSAKVSLEELNSKLVSELENARRTSEEIESKAAQSDERARKIEELMSAKVSLEELNSKLGAELENARRTSEEIESKAAQSDELARKIEELMSAKVSLEELNSKLVADLEKARRRSEDIESKATQSDELARKIEELMSARVSLEELNSKLVADLENARRRSEDTECKATQSDELARKVEELMSAKVSLEELNSKLIADLENARRWSAESESKATQSDELVRKIEELMSAKVSLEELNIKLTTDLEEERQNLEKVRSKNIRNEDLSKGMDGSMNDELLSAKNSELCAKLQEEKRTLLEVAPGTVLQKDNLLLDIEKLRNDKATLEELNAKLVADLEAKSSTPMGLREQYSMSDELQDKVKYLTEVKATLEEANAKLMVDLQARIQESEEIQGDICSLKTDIKQLQETIYLLTNENFELSTKLSTQLEKAKEAAREYQEKINELCQRISTINNEKTSLEDNVALLSKKLHSIGSEVPGILDGDKGETISKLAGKVHLLTEENARFSINVEGKVKEIDEMQETNSLKYGHQCRYREEVEKLNRDIETIKTENSELSDDLMEKIADLEVASRQYEALQSKYDMSLKTIADFTVGDIHHLRDENDGVECALVELHLKIQALSAENENFSKYFSEAVVQNDLAHSPSLEDSQIHLATLFNNIVGNLNGTASKIKDLVDQVERTKRLNKKLSVLKRTPCTQCGYKKELNESCRPNKLDVKKFQKKLDNYGRQLRRKSAEVEALANKAHEDLHLSGYDSSFNSSSLDEMNVSHAEEKLQSLPTEFGIIHTGNENLAKICNNSSSGLDRLQENGNTSEGSKASDRASQAGRATRRHELRGEKLEKDIDQLKGELQEMQKEFSKCSSEIAEFISSEKAQLIDETTALKSANTKLQEKVLNCKLSVETANGKVKLLEEEVSKLLESIKQLNDKEKDTNENKLHLEVELEGLRTDTEKKDKVIIELQQTINELNDHLSALEPEIELLRKQNEDLIASNEHARSDISCLTTELESMKIQNADLCRTKENMELRHNDEVRALQANYEESCKVLNNKLDNVNGMLSKYTDENHSLKQEVTKLNETIERRACEIAGVCENGSTDDWRKSHEELERIKKTIIKEIKSLKSSTNPEHLSTKSVDELFRTFFEAIMLKEVEVAEALQEKFNKARRKLEDEMEQSADATKRVQLWAKELEAETEKLQADLTKQERTCKEYREKISQLEHSLNETNNEKSVLMEKIETLEIEFNNLQIEIEKRSKARNNQQEEVVSQQRREKIVHEAVMKREVELQSKFNAEKEEYERRISDFTCMIDTYKTKNMELRNNIEGLEANEKQLKNIIDIKSSEAAISNQRLQKVEAELAQVTDVCNESNRHLEEKDARLAEITKLLKTKCDLLSEYKNKVETITPEYETLKEQAQERKICIERCKAELESEKIQKQKELDILRDQLNLETVRGTSLNKQINDLTNKNTALMSELSELQSKYEELERANLQLERRIRHSTNKIKAEAEMEELRDLNKTLQSNLEGACNRITELQESKKHLLADLLSLKAQYDCMSSENDELRKTLCSYKSKLDDTDLHELRTKYDNLLQNKNKLALELEGNKLQLLQKSKELEGYVKQIAELIEKNKELDEECEDLANEIRKRNTEYAELEEKYFSLVIENQKEKPGVGIAATELLKQVEALKHENTELREQVASLERSMKEHCSKVKRLGSTTKSENNSGNSSTTSPLFLESNRRRRSRNDFLDEKRHIEDVNRGDDMGDECEALRKKMHELELELVLKNGKLATLEMQIQSENFPYQRKCKDMEEKLLAVMNKNSELKNEVRKMQKALRDIGSRECDVCRRWQTNKRDQTTQTLPDNVIRFCGKSSGVVEEHVKIQKLEKAHALMKNLCRTRNRRIKELEDRVRELEDQKEMTENFQESIGRPNATQPYAEKRSERDTSFRL